MHLLYEIGLDGQVVRIPIEPHAAGCCALGRTFVFPFRLEEVVAHEDFALVILPSGAVFAQQVAGEYDLVKEIPVALIEQGALAYFIEEVVPGIVEVVGVACLLLLLTSEAFAHALILGVVVKVAHYNNV